MRRKPRTPLRVRMCPLQLLEASQVIVPILGSREDTERGHTKSQLFQKSFRGPAASTSARRRGIASQLKYVKLGYEKLLHSASKLKPHSNAVHLALKLARPKFQALRAGDLGLSWTLLVPE